MWRGEGTSLGSAGLAEVGVGEAAAAMASATVASAAASGRRRRPAGRRSQRGLAVAWAARHGGRGWTLSLLLLLKGSVATRGGGALIPGASDAGE